MLRRLRAERDLIAVVFGVVLVTSFIFSAIPRLFNEMADDGLSHSVTSANPLQRNLQMSQPGRIALATDGREAVVTISDRGAGVSEPIEGMRLLTTLGSTKPGGSGLGLPIAAKIVHDHAGTLRLEPAEGGGARAIVRLPLDAEVTA